MTEWRNNFITLLLGMFILGSVAACSAPGNTGVNNGMPVLRWGGDAEGGAPFVEADPSDPQIVHGFDVDIANIMAGALGRRAEFVQVSWSSIEQSVARGDFDVGMSGLEDRPELRERLAVGLPYFEFREVLAVRSSDSLKYPGLRDLRSRRVATLGSTQAYTILLDAAERYGVIPVSYDDDVHPYEDLVSGRVDAVLLDHVIADRALRRRSGFVIQPGVVATGHYVAVFPPGNTALRDSADRVLLAAMADGTLEGIFRRWGVWDSAQAAYQSGLIAAHPELVDTRSVQIQDIAAFTGGTTASKRTPGAYMPALWRAMLVTVFISITAMLVAIFAGSLIAAGRVYGGPLLRAVLLTWVEIIRGTPVLLQLFVLYYGLAAVIRLPAMAAAILGLGLNYAAYESEIYRAALQSIPKLQLEAARTLGLGEWQILRFVRAPQAVRIALAPMTNDFVALLKDSSLVSVITVVELTKQTAIYATNVGSWVVPGLICGALYLVLSLPLSRLARSLEVRWGTE